MTVPVFVTENLRERVRDRYATAAVAVGSGSGASALQPRLSTAAGRPVAPPANSDREQRRFTGTVPMAMRDLPTTRNVASHRPTVAPKTVPATTPNATLPAAHR